MRRRYWTHLPAATVWVGFVIWFLSRSSEWPSRVPLQVGWAGEVTSWGSPWLAFGLVAGLGFFFIGLTVVLDDLWAQQESQKRFNFLSLLDEFVVSLLVTVQAAFLLGSVDGTQAYRFPWGMILLVVGIAVGLAMLSELKRPFRAGSGSSTVSGLESERLDAFSRDLARRIDGGETIVFWDIQNPKYVAWLSIGIPLLLWASAGFLIRESLWSACLNVAIGVLLLLFYGGQRTCVSSDGITLRYGLMGIRIFRCQLAEIVGVRIRSFAPLADFGGYGIRMRRGVTAYFLAGGTGVQVDFTARRSALIGSSNPERLAAVIEVLSGVPLTDDREGKL